MEGFSGAFANESTLAPLDKARSLVSPGDWLASMWIVEMVRFFSPHFALAEVRLGADSFITRGKATEARSARNPWR
jgi:hypothetical protein